MNINNCFAFPFIDEFGNSEKGLTMRQWYATSAMQGMLSYKSGDTADEIAGKAFAMADAMIRAEYLRKKPIKGVFPAKEDDQAM